MTLNDIIPYAIMAGGLLLGAHFLMSRNEEKPELSLGTNTVDYPGFPQIGIEPIMEQELDNQDIWPHPYAHPKIPRYIGAPAYFQNSMPMEEEFYASAQDIWYDKNEPPLLVKVSQNQPSPETYSHHHFYFDQQKEPEPSPLDMGIFKNLV
jgi:hypothetical protein